MKHIEIFEKYNNITKKQQEAIEKLSSTWYESKIIGIHVEIVGGTIGENHKLEDICKIQKDFNKSNNIKDVRIIIENKRRILSDDEIDLINKSKKYNL